MYTLCTGSYSNPLDRQLQERVNITSFKGPILMNRRNEMGGVRVERTRYLHEMGWQLLPPLEWRFPLPNAILQASRGEEGGQLPGWRNLGEDGGWRFSTTLLNLYKEI